MNVAIAGLHPCPDSMLPTGLGRLFARAGRWLRCAGLLLTLLGAGPCQGVEVIVNATVDVTQLSKRQLRAIYTMRLEQWQGGGEIRVFVLPPTDRMHQRFSKSLLQALPHQLQAVWYRLVYSGMGAAPVEVRSQDEMVRRVRETPGAIGYVGEGRDTSDVQVVKIET